MEYQVDLDTFRGPLDLLLYLVKRNEVDICDIPIAKMTGQFLDYLRVLQVVDVERAGDFLVMASTLMEIKSKMLLPRAELGEDEHADPRQELVRQLIEYKKYKDAAALLEAQAERHWYRMPRQVDQLASSPDPARQPLRAVELWDLVSAFGRLMRETLSLQAQQIVVDETPQHVHEAHVMSIVTSGERVPFTTVFSPPRTRGRLVGLFLAILELIKTSRLVAEQDEAFGAIWLVRSQRQEVDLGGTP